MMLSPRKVLSGGGGESVEEFLRDKEPVVVLG
jgi:hypothetical protein